MGPRGAGPSRYDFTTAVAVSTTWTSLPPPTGWPVVSHPAAALASSAVALFAGAGRAAFLKAGEGPRAVRRPSHAAAAERKAARVLNF
ncbi:hypothetical protein [Streptomyces sp. NPDC015125]|uniref:hypothetical protein n=1 Tax=Streptomyces sp. NPDC015125 TaxID=3364938 RepID=UPI0036FD767F